MLFSRNCLLVLIVLTFYFYPSQISAQCITAFPYQENFETSNGNWTAGGLASDWAWGTPNKPVITGAGQGLKCWVSGGLNGSSYANGQRSYVKSPCFDFTNLAHPVIEFKVFWETEYHYDGANLQYSLNNGTTWINVGAYNDPTDCYTANWYNYNSINYLSTLATVKQGWSGNIQPTAGSCVGGNGSNGWVVAKHCLNNLAGLPNVVFRFTFGAGTSCNGFDGFGFDQVIIKNAAPLVSNFGFACNSNPSYHFIDSSTNCPSSWIWNFGDPASGAANSSTLQNPNHSFSAPGIYTVQLIASNTCSGADTATKTVSVLSLQKDSINVACPGGNNGLATITVAGATNPLVYTWNTTPIQTNDTIQNLTAGTYNVVISSNATCSISTTFHLTQPTAFSHSFTNTASICGSPTGSINLTVAGGTPNYTYTWLPAVSTTSTASNLTAGNLTVTIADQNNCIDTMHVVVPAASNSIVVNTSSINQVSCFGKNDGTATISVSGGNPAYNYAWTPNISTSNSAAALAPGIYTVTVSDVNNCLGTTSFTITQPTAFSHSFTSTSSTCGLSNGSINLTVSGGTPNYTYTWLPAVSITSTASNLTAGNLTVTIADQNNCIDTMHVVVPVASNSMVVNTGSISQVSCFGKNNGAATISVSGGTPTYNYVWTPNISTSNSASAMAPGNYTVNVTDANNCSGTTSFTITQPNAFSHSFTSTASTCGSPTGSINLTVAGGTPNYSYTWMPAVSTTSTASNLVAGNLTVTIADQNNCIDTMHVLVPIATNSLVVNTSSINQVSCFGKNDGAATISVSGGNPAYNYVWTPSVSSTNSAAALAPGIYTVNITDANNCAGTTSFTISQPTQIVATSTIQSTTCALSNGSINLLVSGGTGPYTYSWSPSASTNAVANNLAAGTYITQIQDAKSCILKDTNSVASSVALQIQLMSIDDTCGKGIGYVNTVVLSGTAPFQYQWQNFSSSASFLRNLKGNQQCTVQVTDANNCQAIDSVYVAVFGLNKLNLGPNTTVCPGVKTVEIHLPTNNTAIWNDGSTSLNYSIKTAGIYAVTITNEFGCKASDTIFLTESCTEILMVPNAFTPNDDGMDDVFGPIITNPGNVHYFRMSVYNRWGERVFFSKDAAFLWDGKIMNQVAPMSVYMYMIEYYFDDPSAITFLKGDVTLIR